MLVKFSVMFIKVYQSIPFSCHNNCRFWPSCSNYAIEAIERYGFFRGWFLTLRRIVRCNPWSGMGYDPVPELDEKL